MPKVADLGSGGAKNDRDGGAGCEKWVKTARKVGDLPQMDANERKWASDASERRPYLSIMDFGCGRERSPSGPLFSGA